MIRYRTSSGVFIKWTGALKKIDKVVAHAKYIGFRSQEKNDRGFFAKYYDNIDYKKFIERIEENPALKHSSTSKAHKLIFSLKETDYIAYLRSGKDFKDLVRATLAEYEKKHGIQLDWIANIHNAKGHPHCHVIIKAVSDNKVDGRYKRIYFKKSDFKELKDIFNREFERDVKYRPFERIDVETLNDMSKIFERVAKTVERDTEKEYMKAEFEKMRKKMKQRNKGKER